MVYWELNTLISCLQRTKIIKYLRTGMIKVRLFGYFNSEIGCIIKMQQIVIGGSMKKPMEVYIVDEVADAMKLLHIRYED